MAIEVSPESDVTASPSLARGAVTITIASALSRLTGFIRVMVLASAVGGTYLVNTYQTANTAPNVVFELVAAGVLTSVFVPTFVEYLVRREEEEGWKAANALTSVALVGLVALSVLIALIAPYVMRLLTLGVEDPALRAREISLGTTLLRLFAPQVVFYGLGMIMTGALHAHRRFGLAAVAPIFNNVVVIGVYATYAWVRRDEAGSLADITMGETLLLGLGTTLGVVAMTVCLVPQLRSLGWRFRWRFDIANAAVRKAARVGVWALGYAGGYQAGLLIVLVLANKVRGGVAAYQWAYVFFFVPHALFAAPIFHVLFPAMSEDAARGEVGSLKERLTTGLSMLVFILAPIAALIAVAAEPLSRLTLDFGIMSQADADLVGRVLVAFAVGLPTYSAFLVLTRAFYAMNDAKTPALINGAAVLISSAVAALLFFSLSENWSVPGLAFGHSVGFAAGTIGLVALLARRGLSPLSARFGGAVVRSLAASLLAGLASWALIRWIFDYGDKLEQLLAVLVVGLTGALVYAVFMVAVRSPEMGRMTELVGGRAGAPAKAPVEGGRVLEVVPRSEGGIAKHVAQVVDGLQGREELVIDLAAPRDLPYEMRAEIHEIVIPSGPLFGHRKVIRSLRALLREERYAVVHAHGLRAGIDAGLAARGSPVRVLLTVHNLVLPETAGRLRSGFYRRAEPLAVRLSDRTFGASDQIARHLRAVAPDQSKKIETLHAPVEPPPVARCRAEVRAELGLSDERLVITAARLAPQKALHVMLDALAQLPDDVMLAVVGEGPLEAELKQRAGELGLDARVRWMGFRDDVGDFIAAADVFCLSSVWEAVALAAQEAALLGTPVVSTDVGGMAELIEDGDSGRLVPVGDAGALAVALRDVLDSPQAGARYAQAAGHTIRTRFSRETMLERLLREYRRTTDA
ncbi:MAG: murein biosynthesis integral membrane protein MurJ [Actinomycetota bacterium]|nr:murein biosynthesis integral membrane protein MurJ [Actinomycetota bacterium]